MAFYELVFIVRPDVATTQVDALTKKLAERITETGGKIIKTEYWGLRALAYKINKHKKGYYTMLGIEASSGTFVQDIEHTMKLNDDIIRFLTTKVDEISDEPSVMLKAKAKADAEAAEFEEIGM